MRKRYKYLLFSGVLLLVLIIGAYLGKGYIASGFESIRNIFLPREEQLADFSKTCTDSGGTWVEKYKECENIPAEVCYNLNGDFVECDSPCRHMGPQSVCIEMCVSVCKFK